MNLVITFSRRYCSGTSIIVKDLRELLKSEFNINSSLYDKSYFENKENLKNFEDEQKEIKEIVTRSNETSYEVCIFVGRSAANALTDYENILNIYCYAAKEERIERAMEKHQITEEEATELIKEKDKEREEYHFKNTNKPWSSVDEYDILLDTSVHKKEECGRLLLNYLIAKDLI